MKIRKERGMSLEDMSKSLKIGVTTYFQYEQSQRNIPYDIAKSIAEILDVEVNDIFLPVKFTVSKTKEV